MAKLDYKKLWEQQKKDNILMRSENEKLNRLCNLLETEVDNAKSWEQLYNKQQGQAEGIMRCFKELLNNKNQQSC